MKTLSILGSTGSIGVSTLELVAAHPDKFKVAALAAGTNLPLLVDQINAFSPEVVSVLDAGYAQRLEVMLTTVRPKIVFGVTGMIEAATVGAADMVVAAIVGAAGLVPTAAAIAAGKDIALANKETLVTAGRIIMEMVERHGVKLYPVDSEHSAIFQSLQGHRTHDIKRIVLTASGGPFLSHSAEDLSRVTVQDALAHPNWNMGKKITIDSATMMNKGLEVIEAHWLFDLPGNQIDVLINPQSIVHSMVEYIDGCMIAQLGVPDMKAPIAYALTYPERVPTGVKPLDLPSLSSLVFKHPDVERFPALKLAYRAMEEGESMPAVMNAANEIAVAAFLEGKIGFTDIPLCIEKTMDAHSAHNLSTIEEVLRVDLWGRQKAVELVDECAASSKITA